MPDEKADLGVHTVDQPVVETAPQEAAEDAKIEAQVESRQEHVEKPAEVKEGKLKHWIEKLKLFLIECRRVLRVTKKPDSSEFKTVVKISGIGLLVIGLIGFVIHFLKELLV